MSSSCIFLSSKFYKKIEIIILLDVAYLVVFFFLRRLDWRCSAAPVFWARVRPADRENSNKTSFFCIYCCQIVQKKVKKNILLNVAHVVVSFFWWTTSLTLQYTPVFGVTGAQQVAWEENRGSICRMKWCFCSTSSQACLNVCPEC